MTMTIRKCIIDSFPISLKNEQIRNIRDINEGNFVWPKVMQLRSCCITCTNLDNFTEEIKMGTKPVQQQYDDKMTYLGN